MRNFLFFVLCNIVSYRRIHSPVCGCLHGSCRSCVRAKRATGISRCRGVTFRSSKIR